jgi:hypothetical protein
MRFWLDCEWNDWGGELISIALVGDDNSHFYGVLPFPNLNPTQWVKDNVLSVIDLKSPTYYSSISELQRDLSVYLRRDEYCHIVADWPTDIQHFCALLINGPGTKVRTPPLSFKIINNIIYVSEIPHNALADAVALRIAYSK